MRLGARKGEKIVHMLVACQSCGEKHDEQVVMYGTSKWVDLPRVWCLACRLEASVQVGEIKFIGEDR